jgi:hypothetical protein
VVVGFAVVEKYGEDMETSSAYCTPESGTIQLLSRHSWEICGLTMPRREMSLKY